MKEKEIKLEGFTTNLPPMNGTGGILNIAVFGPEGGGKSTFLATAPDPIAGVITDLKSEDSIRKSMERHNRVVLWSDFIQPKDPLELDALSEEQFKKYYRGRVTKMKEHILKAYHHPKVRTLFIDNFGDFCREVKFALQGSEQKFKKIGEKVFQDNDAVYQEIIDLLRIINNKHTILTNKWKDEYLNNAPTKRMTWDGFKYLGNHTNLAVELVKNLRWNPESESEENQWHYGLNIRNCLHKSELEGPQGKHGETGLRDEMVTFQALALTVFPESEPSEWE